MQSTLTKIYKKPKIQNLNNSVSYKEIIIQRKGKGFRARSSCLSNIPNIKINRPEAYSSISEEDALQKLIPKIQDSLSATNKKMGQVFSENGKILYALENIIYVPQNNQINGQIINNELLSKIYQVLQNISSTNSDMQIINTLNSQTLNKKVTEVANLWFKELFERTKKKPTEEDYLAITTFEGYKRVYEDYILPYFNKNSNLNNILLVTDELVDNILDNVNGRTTKKHVLVDLKLLMKFAKRKMYITDNPIESKALKRMKSKKKQEKFIEEDRRSVWINCMLEEINNPLKSSDAPLAFLLMLLHSNRPEEACGTKWKDFDFEKNDYHIQNAYSKIPIYNEKEMKRIGWKHGDVPLKTPESDRHIPLDPLIKQKLLEHMKNQKEQYKKAHKKWSINEYVFHNTKGTPFIPENLSKNFSKFRKRNKLENIVIYSLRHTFASHCKSLGMEPEILAELMGHTEYSTTQKYYVHVSAKDKRTALEKIQKKEVDVFINNEK